MLIAYLVATMAASMCGAGPPAPAVSPFERLARVRLDGAEVLALDPRQPALLVAGAQGVTRIDLSAFPDLNASEPWTLGARPGDAISHVEVDPAGRGIAIATVIPKRFAAAPGAVVFFDPGAGQVFASSLVGHNPDCCKFTVDGSWIVVANEGQPESTEKTVVLDPPGAISIIDLRNVDSPAALGLLGSRTFTFDGALRDQAAAQGLRIHPANAQRPALDLEPEYIAVLGDTAWVTLQENNALAVVDIPAMAIERLVPLGAVEQTIDASDRDGGAHVRSKVATLPMPDQVAAFTVDGRDYLITANEGDDRGDLGDSPLADVERLAKLHRSGRLSPGALSEEDLSAERLGRLKACAFTGDSDGDGLIDRPHAPGSRSVSVWDARTLERLADTGSAFETLMAAAAPDLFNRDDGEDETDSRSDARGPEPEGVAVFVHAGRTFAVVTLERPGALALVDLSRPAAPEVIGLHIAAAEGDTGPEGVIVFDGALIGVEGPVVAAAYEASGTLALYRIRVP